MIKYFWVFICSLLLSAQVAFAQDIQISASVTRNVISIDEQLEFDINITGQSVNIPGLELPELQDFKTYSGGRSQNVSIINGKVSSSLSFRYALVPKSVGNFTIPAVVLQYNGQNYSTQPIGVQVVKSAASSQAAQQQAPQGGGSEA